MIRIIGLSGSLRRGSFNTSLLRAARGSLPEDAELAIEPIARIPLYNADDERAGGVPEPVAALKDRIAGADALLISTPEYNHSMPGVLKNAVDWLSRPPDDVERVFAGLPVALMGASPGRFGTSLAQNAWLPVLRTLGADLWRGQLLVAGAGKLFDERGELVDEATRRRLDTFVRDFVASVRR